MGVCRVGEKPYKVVLRLLVTTLGSVAVLFLSFNITQKWHLKLTDDLKRRPIPRLCYAIILSIAIERIFHALLLYAAFYSSTLGFIIALQSRNIVLIFGVYSGMASLLILRLISSFKGSVFEVSPKQQQFLYGMAIVDLIVISVGRVMLGLPGLRQTSWFAITIIILNIAALFLSVILTAVVDTAFGRRLRTLVVMNHEQMTQEETDQQNNQNSDKVNRIVSLMAMKSDSTIMRDPNQLRYLTLATQNMVLAGWIHVFIVLLVISSTLVNFGGCKGWVSLIGEVIDNGAFLLATLVISLTLPHNQDEYEKYCLNYHMCLQRVVSWNAHRVISMANPVSVHSPQPSDGVI